MFSELPHSDAVLQLLIEEHMTVSDADKQRLIEEWTQRRMPHGKSCPACAGCGLRDPDLHYDRIAVADLQTVLFQLTDEDISRREQLGWVTLLSPSVDADAAPSDTGTVRVDLRTVMSCWRRPEGEGGGWYHLHPELVDTAQNGGSSAMMCDNCVKANTTGCKYQYSIAAGVDYGWLQRVHGLEPLRDMERMLLSETRLYHVVMQVRNAWLYVCFCMRPMLVY